MKRLTIVLLMTLAFNNAFGMQEGQKNEEIKTQVQAKSNVRKDLTKGLTALVGAGLFGGLSYACYAKQGKKIAQYNRLEKLLRYTHKTVGEIIFDYVPTHTGKEYYHKYSGIVSNALIAVPFAAYAAYKLGSVLASKLRSNKNASVESKNSKTRSLRASDNIDLDSFNKTIAASK